MKTQRALRAYWEGFLEEKSTDPAVLRVADDKAGSWHT